MWQWIKQYFDLRHEVSIPQPPEYIIRELQEIRQYCVHRRLGALTREMQDVWETIERLATLIGG